MCFLISFAFLKQSSQKVNMAFESEYQLEDVAATRVASDEIDATFRSTSIGKSRFFALSNKSLEARDGDASLHAAGTNCDPPGIKSDTDLQTNNGMDSRSKARRLTNMSIKI